MDDREIMVLEVGSLDEARNLAAARWSIDPDEIIVKVIEEEKSFFGFLGRKLTVEARPSAPLSMLSGKKHLDDLLGLMGLDVETIDMDHDFINISGEDAGIVIGKYGETLKSLEYLVNLMLRDMEPQQRLRLDSDGYRARREASLQRLALSAARKALKRERPTYLEPMSSWERRIIHMTLKERTDIETRSIGDEPSRKVVVWPSRTEKRSYRRR